MDDKVLTCRFQTLTPLWTGGIGGKVDCLHETGIMGSLRWWFEVLARGLGAEVKDPVSNECSIFDIEKYKNSTAENEHTRLHDAGLCDVSQVFGATGWRRRFRMTIFDNTTSDSDSNSPKRIKILHINKESTWVFPDYPRSGSININVQSTDGDFPVKVIGGLLQFIADWVAIGSKTQMGFGVISPMDDRYDTKQLYNWLIKIAGSEQYRSLPTLRNIFIAHVKVNGSEAQDMFNMKYDLRWLFEGEQKTKLRHFIMGTIAREGKEAAKIKMSRPYGERLMRIWGWIPEESRIYKGTWSRESVVDTIYKYLQDKCSEVHVWREMNSSRDTMMPNNGDVSAFLGSLLKIGDEL